MPARPFAAPHPAGSAARLFAPLASGLAHAAVVLAAAWPHAAVAQAAPAPAAPPPLARVEVGMHTAMLRDAAADATGRWAVTVGLDKTARVWDLATGQPLQVLRPPIGPVREGELWAVALSPDGQTVALGGYTGPARDGSFSVFLFARTNGLLHQRLPGVDGPVRALGYSPDGRWLAATTARGTVQLFDAGQGHLAAGRSDDCRSESNGAQFSPDSRWLVTTCWDGQLRRYAVGPDGQLGPPQRVAAGGGRLPWSVRHAPDGQRLAVGYRDAPVVQVLDARTLAELARPVLGDQPRPVPNSHLSRVAWSADGRTLAATGRLSRDGRAMALLRWPADALAAPPAMTPVARELVSALAPLPQGGWLWSGVDPAWGVLDADGRPQHRAAPPTADLTGPGQLRLSADGGRVRFLLTRDGSAARSFDLAHLRLGADDPALAPARTQAPGLDFGTWLQNPAPTLNGQPLGLATGDEATALAISADAQRFALGTAWSLRWQTREGRLLWQRPVPDVVQGVVLTADGQRLVAAHGDGTLRWYRTADGRELLAVLVHRGGRRWTAWLPEGFYAASDAEAESWMGFHIHRGRDQAGDFVSARQLRARYYQPELVARRLAPDGDARVAEAVRQLGHVDQVLGPEAPPPPTLELLSPARVSTELEAVVRVRLTGGAGAQLVYRIDGAVLEGRPVDIAGTADGSVSRSFALPPGRREISVAALDARGVESPPVTVVAEVRPPRAGDPALHLLAVGVTRYRDATLQRGVRFAASDAQAVRDLFVRQAGRLFSRVDARLLTDEQASGDAIRAALAEMAGRMAPQDVAVVYLAGHGLAIERQYHFIPWDAVYSSADALRQRSLAHQQFSALLARLPATKTLVLLDTCSSGAFGREPGRDLGDKDAIDRLARLSGRATIAATTDSQIALEGEAGHGAFTHVLLQGLQGEADRDANGTVDVRELADFIEAALPKLTARRWGVEQWPFSATEGQSFPLLPTR